MSVILIFGRERKKQLFHLPSNLTASLPAETWDQSGGDKAEEWISAVLEV